MKILIKIAVIIIMLGLYMFEASKMFVVDTSVQSSIIYPLLVVLGTSFIILIRKVRISHKLNTVILFNILFYLLALLHSVQTPFETRAVYLTFLLPLFCLMLASIIARDPSYRGIFLNGIFIVYLLLTLFYYKNYQNNILVDVDSQSNSAYTLLYLTPILLCHEKKIIRYVVLFLTGIALLYSLKRSGLISFMLASVIYAYIEVFVVNKKKNKILLLLLILLGVFFTYGVIHTYFSDRTDVLLDRFEELGSEGGSGRDVIYQSTWEMISRSNILNILLGHGYNSVARDSIFKLSAHNDYLEIMYDYGIFALLLLVVFLVQILRSIFISIHRKSEYSAPIAFAMTVIMINSNFSHIFFYEWYFMLIALFWGYVVSIDRKPSNVTD